MVQIAFWQIGQVAF